MRAGWIGNLLLQERLHRADPDVGVMIEAGVAARESIKDIFDDWAGADDNPGVPLREGGARLAGVDEALVEYVPAEPSIELEGLTRSAPFRLLRVEWADGNDAIEVHRLVARTVAQLDINVPKAVAFWRARLYRLEALTSEVAITQELTLAPISGVISIPATGGVSPVDVEFLFQQGDTVSRIGGPPVVGQDPASPLRAVTFVHLWAVDDEGSPAGNCAWLAGPDDPVHMLKGFAFLQELVPAEGATSEEGSVFRPVGSGPGTPWFRLMGRAYEPGTWSFTGAGNRLDLGAAPSDAVRVVAEGETPADSSISYEISPDGVTWYDVRDGDLIGEDNSPTGGTDLSGIPVQQTYQGRVTLTPSGNGAISPTVRRFGVQELREIALDGVATLRSAKWAVDPTSLKPETLEAHLQIIREGVVDYLDVATELFSEFYPGQIEFRVWVGAPSLPRQAWMYLETFLVDDYTPLSTGIDVLLIAPDAYLHTALPRMNSATEVQEPLEYQGATLAAVYSDLIAGQVAVPPRYLGPGVTETEVFVSKRITNSEGKDELAAVSYLAKGATLPSQGRLKFRELHHDRAPVAMFPLEEISIESATPSLRSRTPEIWVDYGWDSRQDRFEGRVLGVSVPGITRFGRARVDPPEELDREVARWIQDEPHAIAEARRIVDSRGTGLYTWEFRSIYAHPYIEPGDAVLVETDRFVLRDPVTPRPIRGLFWARAIVTAVHDAMGRHFTVWVQDTSDLIPGTINVELIRFANPRITSGDVVFSEERKPTITLRVEDAKSVRFAHSPDLQPSRSTVLAQDVHAVDVEGEVRVEINSVYELGEVFHLSALAFEKADGAGAESFDLFRLRVPVTLPPRAAELEILLDGLGNPVHELNRTDPAAAFGRGGVRLVDPDDTAVRVRLRRVQVLPDGETVIPGSGYELLKENPLDDDTFEATVPVPQRGSGQLVFEVESSIAGRLVSREKPFAFDFGPVAELLALIPDHDAAGNFSASFVAGVDSRSVKLIGYRKSAPPADVLAAVLAASPINAAQGTSATLVAAEGHTDVIVIAGLAFTKVDGAGYRSTLVEVEKVYHTPVVLGSVRILGLSWTWGLGPTGEILGKRQLVVDFEVDAGVESVRFAHQATGTPGLPSPDLSASYLKTVTPGGALSEVLKNSDGLTVTDYPTIYGSDILIQLTAYTNAVGTEPSAGVARAVVADQALPGGVAVIKGATEVAAAELVLGKGLKAVSVTGRQITIGTDEADADTRPVATGGTGRDVLTAASLLVGAGTDPVGLIAPGTNGQILKVVAGVWAVADESGAVTSLSGGAGIAIAGTASVPIVSLEGQALALHNLATNGLIVRTGADTFATRSLANGAGITISTADGISANPQIALAGQALALHALATNGLIARTGAGTVAGRSVVAGAGLTVTDGDGVAGNPTLAIQEPGTLSATTTNSSAGNHTHALNNTIGRVFVVGSAGAVPATLERPGDIYLVIP